MEVEPKPVTKPRLKKIPKSELTEEDHKNIALINDLKKKHRIEDGKIIKELSEADYDNFARKFVAAILDIHHGDTEPRPRTKKVVKEIETSGSEEEIVVVKTKKPNVKRVEPRPVYAHAEDESIEFYEEPRLIQRPIDPVRPKVMDNPPSVPQPEIRKSRYKNPPNK